MPYPMFRMNPLNSCQMQQSIDGGETWVTVLDSSACSVPADPPPPMIRLRQNPTQPKLLEQSLNGGASWTTAYDFSKYRSGASQFVENIAYQTEVNNYITENNNLWQTSNQNVNNFAPNLVFNGTSEDANRNRAICYAVRVFVHTIMETAFQAAATPSALDDLAALAFSGIVTGIGTFLGGPVGAAIGAFFSGGLITLLRGTQDTYTRETYSQYEDELICCMYTALKDEIPTPARFAASFSGAGCDLNEQAQGFVNALVVPLLSENQNFLAFLRLASEGVSLGEFLPECPCEDEEEPPDEGWIVVNWKQDGMLGWEIFNNFAEFVNGQGWKVGASSTSQLAIQKQITGTITDIELTFNEARPANVDNIAGPYGGLGPYNRNFQTEAVILWTGLSLSNGVFLNPYSSASWPSTVRLEKMRYKLA